MAVSWRVLREAGLVACSVKVTLSKAHVYMGGELETVTV